MRIFILSFILALTCIVNSYGQNYVYVVNGNAETLSRINIETGDVDNHIVTLGAVPNQVVYYQERLYVVNSGSASLQIINPSNNAVIREIPLPIGSNPWNADISGNYAYITGFTTASVYKVNLADGSVVHTYPVDRAPEGILVHDNKIYVTITNFNPNDYSYGQGKVYVIDSANNNIVARIDVGKNPQTMVIGPDGLLNVVCTGDYVSITGKIYFIDTASNTAIDSISTGGNPNIPVINSSGIGFISAGGWVDAGHVFSYDALTRTVLRGNSNPILVGRGSWGMGLDSTGMIYSTGQMANSVTQFNSQGSVTANYAVGGGPISAAIIDTRTSLEETANLLPYNVVIAPPYPNPFNSSVIIKLIGEIQNAGADGIEIFDAMGRSVNKLSFKRSNSINSTVTWQGDDYYGNKVSSGVYFAGLTGTKEIVKMVLLR
jgi:YVTN family beta-propeller protein